MRITFCLLSIIFLFTQCGIKNKSVYYWNKNSGPSFNIPKKPDKVNSLLIINYSDSVFPISGLMKLTNLSSIEIMSGKSLQALPSINGFGNLSKIIFNTCSFKTFPFCVGQLKSLKELGFAFCNLTSLPDSLTMFSSLKTLDLIGNQLTSLPHSVSELDSLETIFLNNNQFLQIPTELLSIPRIAYIDLSNSEGEDRPTQNRIDYIYEIETLRDLLKKESIKNVRIEVDNKAEIQKIVDELDDTELQKKLSFHYYIHGFFNSDYSKMTH